MGSQQDSLNEKLTSKSPLVSWLLTPAILGGIALLGFQTYSIVTGKSFADFDFGIGKLWMNEEVSSLKEIDNIKPFKAATGERQSVATSNMQGNNVALTVIVPRSKNNKSLVKENNTSSTRPPQKIAKIVSLDIIEATSLSANFGTKQLQKYTKRLQQEYLINPKLVPDVGRWFVGFSFSPSLCYRAFSYNTSDLPGVAAEGNTRYTFSMPEEERNRTDKAITSYAIGLDFGIRISKKVSLFSGVHYAKYGEQIQVKQTDELNPNYHLAYFMDKKPQYERTENSQEASLPYTNRYSFIEVPIGLSYTLKEYTKSKIALQTAIILQKLDHVNALVYDFDTDYYYWMNSKNEVFRSHGFGGSLGVSFSQFVGERLELYAAPQFKYNVKSTFKATYPINQNQYTAGLQVGFRQQLQ